MTPEQIFPKLFLLRFESQYEITMTFMRLQEFYESPYEQIKGQTFTWDDMFDCYVKHGRMTYWGDWVGFNVPGKVVNEFFRRFWDMKTPREYALWQALQSVMSYDGDYYVIGTCREVDLKHETAHGLYYLSESYRKDMLLLMQKLTPKQFDTKCRRLEKDGYCKEMFLDEIQAYEIDRKNKKFVDVFNKHMADLT